MGGQQIPVVVVATIVPLPEHRDRVIDAFRAVIPKVHEEPGCQLYALHEGTDRLVMIEKWSSQEALDVHLAGPALAELGATFAGALAGAPDVQVVTAVPAGTDALGAL